MVLLYLFFPPFRNARVCVYACMHAIWCLFESMVSLCEFYNTCVELLEFSPFLASFFACLLQFASVIFFYYENGSFDGKWISFTLLL